MINHRNIYHRKRKINLQRLKLLVSKFKFFISSPSSKVGVSLLLISILLILLPYLFHQNKIEDELFNIFGSIGSDLFGGACTFFAFDIIWQQFKNTEEDRGSILDYFKKKEFINTIRRTNTIRRDENIVLIRIMQTWTDLLINQNDKEEFKDAIIESLQIDTTLIQIMLLNPENMDLVEERSEDLSHLAINVEENIYANIRELEIFYKILQELGLEERIEIKLYNINPSIAIYMCPPDLFVNFIRKGQITTRGEQLKLSIDSPISRFINERFNEVWEDPKSIYFTDFLYLKLKVIEQTTSPSNKSSYHEVKYVKHEDLYYIQHPALFNDIANRTGIIIKIEGKKQSFIPKNIMEEKLDSSILSRFRNKYSEIERYFFILEML